MASVYDAYETVIGLECHVQLLTASKLFSPARNRYGDPANENVDFVDAGLPGVLPVPNGRAVELAVRLGVALGCRLAETSVFARKHYFYPDLPKGYQISQYDRPICEGGAVTIDTADGPRDIRLTRIHIEEDAGKSLHAEGPYSLLDFNRAGTPLLEVVSEPELRSADEAMAFFRALRQLVTWLGVCDGNMQEGSLRADANVSVRKKGVAALGQRTETKNLNSIRFLGQAIEHEAHRQIIELEAGRSIVQETRLWNADKKESRSMRSKEEAHDYRYLPDPDLLPITLEPGAIDAARASLPELPRAMAARFSALGVRDEEARLLVDDRETASYFEQALARHPNAKGIAGWVINEDLRGAGISPEAAAALVRLVDEKTITGKIAKDVLAVMREELAAGRPADPARIVEERGLKVERDEGALAAIIQELVEQNPKQVEQYRAGKGKVLGFFVGQVMRATKGQADPDEVNRLLREALGQS